MIKFEPNYFPCFQETRNYTRRELKKRGGYADESDPYFVYKLSEEEIVMDWVDKWFTDRRTKITEKQHYETVWTIKYVDEQTASHLYNRPYNPFSIVIMRHKDTDPYRIKAMLRSVDDSSYGVWFETYTAEAAEKLKQQIMEYVADQKIMNGDRYFEFCKTIGATDFDTN